MFYQFLYKKYDNITEGIIVYKKNGYINYINKSAKKILKYDMVGNPQSIYELIPLEKKEFHKKLLKEKILSSQTMSNKNIKAICFDGSEVYIDISMLPYNMLIIKKSFVQIIKETSHFKELLKNIEDLCMVGYWKFYSESKKFEMSPGLKNIYETDTENYNTFRSYIHQDDIDIVTHTINKCMENKSEYDITYRIISGVSKTTKWISSNGRFIKEDNKHILVGMSHDISSQKSIEFDLKTKTIKAQEALNAKAEFVSSVSHELRTPLNGIVGMISMLGLTELTSKQRKYTNILDNSCGVLLSIINNILDFSKIESGKLSVDLSYFNLEKICNKTIEFFKPAVETKGLELEIIYTPKFKNIISDELKIRQILTNLLANSVKFTQKGKISLLIDIKKEILTLRVKDTGIGIKKDFLEKITSPFTQADGSTTRTYGGSGLGLSIVKSYTNIMKGSLDIKSEYEIGTEIIIKIPISLSEFSKTIIIIEDNMANQFILKEMLENFIDYPVICYDNGKIALDNISSNPSMIFMDLHMPILNGHDCCIELRKRDIKCPIIALTANSMAKERIKCLESGMDDFMLKPITIEDICILLQKYKLIGIKT